MRKSDRDLMAAQDRAQRIQEARASVRFPGVKVQLAGQDGNAFAIIGRVSKALRTAGHPEAATQFCATAMQQPSYDDLLQLAIATVEVQ